VSGLSNGNSTAVLKIARNATYGLGGGVVTLLLRLIISVVIIRSIGSENFGVYVLALATVAVAEILALAGMENTLVKFVSQFRSINDTPRLKGTIIFGIVSVLLLSVISCIGLFCLSQVLAHQIFNKPNLMPVLKILSLALPFLALSKVLSACLQGIKLIKYKVLLQQILSPGFRLICVALALVSGYHLIGVAWAVVMTEIITFICSFCFFFRGFPEMRNKSPIIFEIKKAIAFSLPLLLTGFSNRILAQADILIVGHFMSGTNVGIYGVIKRFAPLIAMPLGAFNSIFAPIISDLFARKMRADLETQFKTVAKWIFMTSLPVFTLLTFFSKEILMAFDPVFVAGSLAMIVLCTGQMANTSTGSVGFMLMMTGRPHLNLLNSGLLCVTNILLNLFLVPKYGIVGGACAGAFSITAIQLLRLCEVWLFLRMHPYRLDFLKPVASCLISVSLLAGIVQLEIPITRFVMLPFLLMLFLLSYTGFLWLLKFSTEDRIILNSLKNRMFSGKMAK